MDFSPTHPRFFRKVFALLYLQGFKAERPTVFNAKVTNRLSRKRDETERLHKTEKKSNSEYGERTMENS